MKRTFYIWILVTYTLSTYGQDKRVIDSLLNRLETETNDTQIVDVYNWLSWEYKYSDPELAYKYGNKALGHARKMGDFNRGISAAYHKLGVTHQVRGNYDSTLYYYIESLKLQQGVGDPRNTASLANNIAAIHFYLEDYTKALDMFRQAGIDYNKIGFEPGIADAYNNVASAFEKLEQHDSAIAWNLRSLQIKQKLGNRAGIAQSFNGLGNNYSDKKEYEKALKYHLKALTIRDSIGSLHEMAESYLNTGGVLSRMGAHHKATVYLTNALSLADSVQAKEYKKYALEWLASSYQSVGDFEKALKYYVRYDALKDSILNESKVQLIAEMEAKFESEKKSRLIAELEVDKVKALAAEARKEKWLWLSGAGGLVLLLLVGMLVMRQRTQRTQREAKFAKKRAELEQQALRARMNPHFLFNSLTSMQHMYVNGRTHEANEFMGKFSLLLRRILDHTGRQQIVLKDEITTLELYLEIEQKRLDEQLTFSVEVEDEMDMEGIEIPPMVVQPFVENAIWHGIVPKGGGRVIVQLTDLNSTHVSCSIQDDGIGFGNTDNKRLEHHSHGIQLTEERLGTKLEVKSREGGGTIINIMIPKLNG